jgi:hypothetical protein
MELLNQSALWKTLSLPLGEGLSSVALSYAWGPPLDTGETRPKLGSRRVGYRGEMDRPWRIEMGRNLLENLPRITGRVNPGTYIGVDQICINQEPTEVGLKGKGGSDSVNGQRLPQGGLCCSLAG